MKVEVLYFLGCPNHGPAVERVRAVLTDEGVSADIEQIEVRDAATAESVGFLGSPSIRINGTDLEVSAAGTGSVGMSCRTYVYGSERAGLPTVEVIRRAVRAARAEQGRQ